MKRYLTLLLFFLVLITVPCAVEGQRVGTNVSIGDQTNLGRAGEEIDIVFYVSNTIGYNYENVYINFSITSLEREDGIEIENEWIESIEIKPQTREVILGEDTINVNFFLPNLTDYRVIGRGIENPPNNFKEILAHSKIENFEEAKIIYDNYIDSFINAGISTQFSDENILYIEKLRNRKIPNEIEKKIQNELKNPNVTYIESDDGNWKISSENYTYYAEITGEELVTIENINDFESITETFSENEIPTIIKETLEQENQILTNPKLGKTEEDMWLIKSENHNYQILTNEAQNEIIVNENSKIEINAHEWLPSRKIKVTVNTTREAPEGEYRIVGGFQHITATVEEGEVTGAQPSFFINHSPNFEIEGKEPPIPIWATILIIVAVITIGAVLTVVLRRRDVQV